MSLLTDLLWKDTDELSGEELNRRARVLVDAIEEVRAFVPNWQQQVDLLRQIGLDRINEALLPAYDAILGLAQLGALFSAPSASEVAVGTGAKAFTIAETSRIIFAPAANLAITLDGDPAVAMYGRLTSYDRESGVLVVEVSDATGAGAHAGWTISATPPRSMLHELRTDNPHAVTAEQVGTLTAGEIQSALASVDDDMKLLATARNVLINPLAGLNQRGVSGTVVLTAGAYGHDRWKAGASGCTYSFAVNNGVTTLNVQAGSLVQVVEASAFAGRAGTYFLSWDGDAVGRIGGGSYGSSGDVSAVCTGGENVLVEFSAGWLSLPQLERDMVTSFAGRPIQQEIQLCQRYFSKSFKLETTPVGNYDVLDDTTHLGACYGVASPSMGVDALCLLPTLMRGLPALTFYGPNHPNRWSYYVGEGSGWVVLDENMTVSRLTTRQFMARSRATGVARWDSLWFRGHWTADAEL